MEKNKTLVHTNLYDIVHGDSRRIFINNAVIVFKHTITLILTGFIKDTNMSWINAKDRVWKLKRKVWLQLLTF